MKGKRAGLGLSVPGKEELVASGERFREFGNRRINRKERRENLRFPRGFAFSAFFAVKTAVYFKNASNAPPNSSFTSR